MKIIERDEREKRGMKVIEKMEETKERHLGIEGIEYLFGGNR